MYMAMTSSIRSGRSETCGFFGTFARDETVNIAISVSSAIHAITTKYPGPWEYGSPMLVQNSLCSGLIDAAL
ncbi:hypothetical protein HMPREF0581_1383 [Mogibacterium timidum ATCC 33093]|uniref:Uncharacterized protein n=2 Tax=Mogibacterium TaxID=86331 RepID=X8J9M8_9FIRM|nr:hypothetical protein HMPREF0581_1383 [Mogibacterium timidum ATCC 33093]